MRIHARRRGREGAPSGARDQFPKADLSQRSLLPVAAAAGDGLVPQRRLHTRVLACLVE
ncbi:MULTISPECIES: hypothetical protein [Rhodococcus]|uniref:hypothetical protein n=1 Tax=Rhodococcus TaxID=1827 RepID=UPI00187C95FD|nr:MULTISPECIES: hypothetical protein [Rhodococcus]MEA1797033.1 hypothetical protein [Rhodococcus qingshengii]